MRQAIEVFQRYLPTRTPLMALTFDETPDYFKITLTELFDITPIQRPFIETVVLTLKQTLGFVRDQNNVFARIELTSNKRVRVHLQGSSQNKDVVEIVITNVRGEVVKKVHSSETHICMQLQNYIVLRIVYTSGTAHLWDIVGATRCGSVG